MARAPLLAVLAVVAVALVAGFYLLLANTGGPPFGGTTTVPRSGPVSTYPASWGIYSGCPGVNTQGSTTTLNGLTSMSYPNSWNTTTIVTLTQVYDTIIGSSAFVNVVSGHGWVVYSWDFRQGGSNNPFPNGNTIVGFFILTNSDSPNGYVTAYYDILNGDVSLSTPGVTSTLTVVCSSSATG